MDDAFGLSADGCHPVHVRAHRAGDGKGLSANIKEAFPPYVLQGVVLLLVMANTFNIAADMASMGEVTELVTGWDRHLATVILALGTLLMQVFIPYHRYVVYLKWLTLSLLAYAAVLFTVHVPWGEVALRTVWPHIKLDATTATVVTGVFGTTISPYLFFWQASEEVEEHAGRASWNPPGAKRPLWGGVSFAESNGTRGAGCSIPTSLHISSFWPRRSRFTCRASPTSKRQHRPPAHCGPLAGEFAFLLFALGILGVGLIGVPVLAGSAGYAIAGAMGWSFGLEHQAKDARGFYGVIAVSVLGGLLLEYTPLSPMKALFWSAVINGVVAIPLMAVIILLASRKSVMGAFPATRSLIIMGWIATLEMGLAALLMLVPSSYFPAATRIPLSGFPQVQTEFF